MIIETIIDRNLYNSTIRIVSVEYGHSRILKNGEWVNVSDKPEKWETTILTFGKFFDNNEEAEKFMKTKLFKSILKNIEKNV